MKLLRSRLLSVLMSFAYVVACCLGAEPPASPQRQQASRHQRLGGYDALAAVSDDFLGHLANDPQMGRFFVGLSTDSRNRVRQHVVDFLCVATGGPCKYTGRDMKSAHTGLNITDPDWTNMLKCLGGYFRQVQGARKGKERSSHRLVWIEGDIVGR